MITYIDLSEKHGHRNDHGFACGAEFNVKIRRRLNIPDFVREQLSETAIDSFWWEEAEQARDSLKETLARRYKWIGALAFVGRSCATCTQYPRSRASQGRDAIGKVVDQHLKRFIKSMESPAFWRGKDIAPAGARSVHHATMKTSPKGSKMSKKSPSQLQRDIDETLGTASGPHVVKISKPKTFAGQRSITASVQYPGEPLAHVEFVGPSGGGSGPVVMVTRRGQTFVTDPSRFGDFGTELASGLSNVRKHEQFRT